MSVHVFASKDTIKVLNLHAEFARRKAAVAKPTFSLLILYVMHMDRAGRGYNSLGAGVRGAPGGTAHADRSFRMTQVTRRDFRLS